MAAFFEGISLLFLLIALLLFGIFTRQQLKSLIDRRLKAMTRFIISSAIGMSIFVLAGICSLWDEVWGVALGQSILFWIFYVSITMTSLSNLNAFVASTNKKSRSAGDRRSNLDGSKASSTNMKTGPGERSKTVEVDNVQDPQRTSESDAEDDKNKDGVPSSSGKSETETIQQVIVKSEEVEVKNEQS